MKRCQFVSTIASTMIASMLVLQGNLRAATPGAADVAHVSALEMARQIDLRIDAKIAAAGLEAAPVCSDEEFLRRVSLDLTGVIPTVAEVREFKADSRADKRTRWIDRLLESPRHPSYLATLWRRIMLPLNTDFQQLQQAESLETWLREHFATNLRYDRLVAAFLSATGEEGQGPAAFYQSLESQPEKLASATSRIFLGLQIQCAECHDHPYDHWTQKDFWGYAAFFAQLQTEGDAMAMNGRYRLVDLQEGEVTLPESDETVAPKFPTATESLQDQRGTRRRRLAIWMASRDNPYLAPAAVNRVWGQMFGHGLVHPIDDLGAHNPPSHPLLMEELTDYFVGHGFDLREVYRAIANTKTYQRSSAAPDLSQPPVAYERMRIKQLNADQLHNSVRRSLHRPAAGEDGQQAERRRVLALMKSDSTDPAEYELGVQQALDMMNGIETIRATEADAPGLLTALKAPFWTADQRVEVLYLSTLSRWPTDAESTTVTDYVKAHDRLDEALGDVLWALLNSAEYQFNH